MDPQYGWRLEITNPDESDLWKAIGSQVRFIHVNTSASIKVKEKICQQNLFYYIIHSIKLYYFVFTSVVP